MSFYVFFEKQTVEISVSQNANPKKSNDGTCRPVGLALAWAWLNEVQSQRSNTKIQQLNF